jgi:filamentous hemagglutinin family protein
MLESDGIRHNIMVNIMTKCNLLIVLITFLVLSLPIHAEVVFDGTLGHNGALPGPNFDIQTKYGQQQGGNLFHSFSQFNIYQGESATFSGPNNIENIISRVTGGNPSQINGLFRSTIPNADVYFLNPYGIMFGEGANNIKTFYFSCVYQYDNKLCNKSITCFDKNM